MINKENIEEIIANGVWTGKEVDLTTEKLYILFKKQIEQLQQERDEWINVETEMPKEYSHGFSQWVLVSNSFFVWKDRYDFHREMWIGTQPKVTHWMPLPKPAGIVVSLNTP